MKKMITFGGIMLTGFYCHSAFAFENKIIGSLDVGFHHQELSGAQKSVGSIEGGIDSTSYLGLAGSETLNNGIRLMYELSGFIRVDEGDTGRADPNGKDDPDQELLDRTAWIGIEGSKGQLKLGRVTSQNFINVIRFNPFGSSSLISPMFMHTFVPSVVQPLTTGFSATDTSWKNAVSYTSPKLSNTVFNLTHTKSDDHSLGNRDGASIVYGGQPWAVMLSYEHTRDASLTGPIYLTNIAGATPPLTTQDIDAVILGSSYDFKTFKLFGQLASSDISGIRVNNKVNLNIKTAQLGTTIPAFNGQIKASAAFSQLDRSWDNETLDRSTLSTGYDYFLNKSATLYFDVLLDKVTHQSVGTSYAIGINYKL